MCLITDGAIEVYYLSYLIIFRLIKVKFRGGALQHYSRIGILYSDPKGVPSFISRSAAHQAAGATSASEGRNYRWNLANNVVIHVDC
jgi:hypothetical protein